MFRKILKKCKSEFGFTGQDLIVAMFILVLFLGIMTGVYVNLSNTSYEIKLTSRATEISTNVMEYFDGIYYDEIYAKTDIGIKDKNGNDVPVFLVDADEFKDENYISTGNDFQTQNVLMVESDGNRYSHTCPYCGNGIGDKRVYLYNDKYFILNLDCEMCDKKIYEYDLDILQDKINLENSDNRYTVTAEATENSSLNEKTIKVVVEYDWKGETYRIENSMVKEKENIKPANSPVLEPEINGTPVKFVYSDVSTGEGYFVKCEADDPEWYNYETGKMAILLSEAEFDTDGKLTKYKDIYVWIPSFYYDKYEEENGLIFYYKGTNKLIMKNSNGTYYLSDNNFDTLGDPKIYCFKDDTGKWVPIDEEMKFEDDVEDTSDLQDMFNDYFKDDYNGYNYKRTRDILNKLSEL